MKLISDEVTGRRYTVSQLAKQAGLSTASIKFYLRERLLPPGDLSAPQRAYYDDEHLRRLLLIRALRELAGLSIAKLRKLLRAVRRGQRTTFALVASAIDALASTPKRRSSSAHAAMRRRVHQKLRARGLEVRDDSATLDSLAQALLGLRAFEPTLDVEVLDAYLDHLVPLARAEFAANEARILASPESALIGALVGTVLFEPLIVALRRLAHEHFATQLYARLAPSR